MLDKAHLCRHEVAVKLVWLKLDPLVVLVNFSLENEHQEFQKVNSAAVEMMTIQ